MKTKSLLLIFLSVPLLNGCGNDVTKPVTVMVTGVAINRTSATLVRGTTDQLTALLQPPDAANRKVSWLSKNELIASVTDSGLITGVSVGVTTVLVMTEDGGYIDSCLVNVIPTSVQGVSLNVAYAAIEIGDTLRLVAEVEPYDAANTTVSWSTSDQAVVTVTDSGLVIGSSLGAALVTVTTEDGGYSDSCRIDVVPTLVTGVSLNMTHAAIEIGNTIQLVARVEPSDAANTTIVWSSSFTPVASVTVAGLVSGMGIGYATITATTEDGGFTDFCDVVVEPTHVTGVTISPRSVSFNVGDSLKLTSDISPSNATDRLVIWSSNDTSIAVASSSGMIMGIGVGTTFVVATTRDGGLRDSCYVTVEAIPVEGVSINKSETQVVSGLTERLAATVIPYNATDQSVSWSSQGSQIAMVSEDGLIRGVSEGVTQITVSTNDGGFSDSCEVTVIPAQMVALRIEPADTTIEIGSSIQFSVEGTRTDGATLNVTSLAEWSSSNGSIANISSISGSKGLAHGISDGSVIILAQLEGLQDSTTLHVMPPYFSEIGVPYQAEDGLTVTLNSLVITEGVGSLRYAINYTLSNQTPDQAVDEGAFKMYFANQAGGLPQYGFFNRLFPGQSINRSYTFEELSTNPFDVLEYHSDNFFSQEPLPNSLKWEVLLPSR